MFFRYVLLLLLFLLILRLVKNALRSIFSRPEINTTPDEGRPSSLNIDESQIEDARFKDL